MQQQMQQQQQMLQQEIEKLKKQLQESEEKQKTEKAQADELRQQLQQAQSKVAEVEKQLADANAKFSEAQKNQVSEALSQLNAVQAERDAKERELNQTKAVSFKFAQMVSVLLKENAALRVNSEKMIADAKAASNQHGIEQVAMLQARITELEGQLAAAQNEKAQMSQEIAQMRAQVSSAQMQTTSMNSQQQELDQARAQIREQEAKIEQLSAKNAELAQTATKAADALTSVSVKFKQCTQLCADEKDRANQAVAMVASLKTQLDEQKRRADSLEQANSAIKDKVDKLLAILRAQGWHPGMMTGAPGQPAMGMGPNGQPMMMTPQQQQQLSQQSLQSMVDLSAIAGEVFPAPQNNMMGAPPGVNPAPGAYGQY